MRQEAAKPLTRSALKLHCNKSTCRPAYISWRCDAAYLNFLHTCCFCGYKQCPTVRWTHAVASQRKYHGRTKDLVFAVAVIHTLLGVIYDNLFFWSLCSNYICMPTDHLLCIPDRYAWLPESCQRELGEVCTLFQPRDTSTDCLDNFSQGFGISFVGRASSSLADRALRCIWEQLTSPP